MAGAYFMAWFLMPLFAFSRDSSTSLVLGESIFASSDLDNASKFSALVPSQLEL